MINPDNLIQYAIKFHLGFYSSKYWEKSLPVYLELRQINNELSWVIYADGSRGLTTVFCFNKDFTWRYKHGSSWGSKEEALEAFNKVVGSSTIDDRHVSSIET